MHGSKLEISMFGQHHMKLLLPIASFLIVNTGLPRRMLIQTEMFKPRHTRIRYLPSISIISFGMI